MIQLFLGVRKLSLSLSLNADAHHAESSGTVTLNVQKKEKGHRFKNRGSLPSSWSAHLSSFLVLLLLGPLLLRVLCTTTTIITLKFALDTEACIQQEGEGGGRGKNMHPTSLVTFGHIGPSLGLVIKASTVGSSRSFDTKAYPALCMCVCVCGLRTHTLPDGTTTTHRSPHGVHGFCETHHLHPPPPPPPLPFYTIY